MRGLPILVLALLAGTVSACGSTGAAADDGTVTVVIAERPTEEAAFRQDLLNVFERRYHIQVTLQHETRALGEVLEADLRTGSLPELAILPSPGEVASFAAQGVLSPLDRAVGNQQRRYGPQWLSVEQLGAGKHIYAAPIKIALKSAVWYDPTALHRLLGASWTGAPPTDWQQLLDLTSLIVAHGGTPWCMGMESTPVSGWPGTDWIEDILLQQSGPAAYQHWADGDPAVPWAGQGPVKQAFRTWQKIVGDPRDIPGGAQGALLRNFDVGASLFLPKPSCYLYHTAYVGDTSHLRPGVDIDFFPFPSINGAGGLEVSGDFVTMFRDTPQAEQLVSFLTSSAGQRLLPTVPGTSSFPVDRTVPEDLYTDAVKRRVAHLLTHAETLCFDASDLMPPAMSDAFYQAVMSFLSDPSQPNLDDSLAEMDDVRDIAYDKGPWTYQCGAS